MRQTAIALFAAVSVSVVAFIIANSVLSTNGIGPSHQLRFPQGVVAAGDSKTNCIYPGGPAWKEGLKAVEQATGITFNCMETFSNADPKWADWVSPWMTTSFGFAQWLAAAPTRRTIILTQQLIPDSVCTSVCADPLRWEKACDAGEFNPYAIQLAKHLIATGFGSSVIRLGAEMNGSWENDFAGTTIIDQRAWARCFAQEVTAMRTVKGEHLLFDWNINSCTQDDSLSDLYPGNAFVDIVGIDAYNAFCNGDPPKVGRRSRFALLAAEPDGLNAVTAFAKSKGKPMSLPEWGSVVTGESGLGDDASYVFGIKRYISRNDVSFQSYFDDGVGGVLQVNSKNPNLLKAYAASFR